MEYEAAAWRELQRLIEEGDKARLTSFLDDLAPLAVVRGIRLWP